jgi:dTDP-4-dehydrorhamnose 3,5-epimerase
MGRKICCAHTRGENYLMLFTETKLKGSYIIEIEKIEDERGFFARSWDKKEFEIRELNPNLVQCDISFNSKKGILRGMHYQKEPFEEAKLVRCTKGRIFDVIVDLRKDSPSKNDWYGIELSQSNHKMIYVPKGFAHGFQTLEENSEVFYQMSQEYMEKHATGKKWNSKDFKISWPILPPILSKKDENWESQ